LSAVISDIDECVIETHACSPAQFCENLDGSFRCHDDYDVMLTSEGDYYELHRDDEYHLHEHAAGNWPTDNGHRSSDSSDLATQTCSPGYRYDPTSQSCNGNQYVR